MNFTLNIPDGGETIPVQQTVTNTGTPGPVTAVAGVDIGIDAGTGLPAYRLPPTIGANGQVLAVPGGSGTELVWVTNAGGGGGGSSNVVKDGQAGPFSIGTNDATDLTLISGGNILIGSASSGDQIMLNGSVAFQHDTISTGSGAFALTANHYFVEITAPAITYVVLPLANSAVGRVYIISKGAGSGNFSIITSDVSNTLDGAPSMPLMFTDQRITVISNGANKWLVI